MRFRYLLRSSLIIFLCLVFSSHLCAQNEKGMIRGKVLDQDGNPLPGVTVIIKGPAIAPMTAITTAEGFYRFPSLPPGKYSIKVELPGFKTLSREDIFVRSGETKEVNITMGIGVIEEQITVVPEKKPLMRTKTPSAAEKPQVSNEVLDDEIGQLSVGQIMFNPPKVMKVGVKERIEARISQSISEDLTERLKGRGIPQVEDIIIGAVMEVKLSSKDFKIESLSKEEQPIQSAGYTQWEWDVTPLKSGQKLIHLSVAVSIYLEKFGEKRKSLPVMDREIFVEVDFGVGISNFFKNNWQWIFGIIGIVLTLLGLYLTWRSQRKKKQQVNKKNEN